jgi:hypothetical protein
MNRTAAAPGRCKPAAVLALCASAAMLAGCPATNPPKEDRPPRAAATPAAGPLRMPSGADLRAARLIEQGRRVKIYAELLGIDDPADKKLLVRAEAARALNITNAQMRRRFVDTVSRSRRFEVYDSSTSVTADQSDLVIDGMVTQATQELLPIEGGVRVSVTRVRLSVQAKHRYDGTPLFAAPVEVVGQTGGSTGDRARILPGESTDLPDVQNRLAVDYERALQRAFDAAARRIDAVIRPMGKLVAVDGDQLGMLGGQVHGFQGGDEVVVFRATTIRLPSGDEEFATTRPVAVARCEGVGTRSSQCTVVRLAPDLRPQAGDFAVLSDASATGVRLD